MDTKKAGRMSAKKRFAGKTKEEISAIMRKLSDKSPTVKYLKELSKKRKLIDPL